MDQAGDAIFYGYKVPPAPSPTLHFTRNGGSTWSQFTGVTTDMKEVEECGGFVFVLGTSSFYKTSNQGGTWISISSGLPNDTLHHLAIDSWGDLTVTTKNEGVWFSSNSGTSWQPVNDGLTNLHTRSLAIEPHDYAYVGTSSGFFRSSAPTHPIVRLSARALLEGPFDGSSGLMNTHLRTAGSLSSRFPDMVVPAGAVDSVNVELRNTVGGLDSSFMYREPAWLLADGSIRNMFDTTRTFIDYPFPIAGGGTYYIVVRHRNHLPIMSATGISVASSSTTSYDFTTGQDKAYGTNPMRLIGTKYCMYAGDGNQSAVVTAADANAAFGILNSTGYRNADINLSGIVTASDANSIFGNLNKASQVP
ncbi:MAG: hypothetical protein HY961_11770 [Ignavibacteriae bacterium]|nr:hypothetical protein [Ignavibacteriota bacterium]